MSKYIRFFGLATLLFLVAACDSGGHKKNVAAAPEIQYGVSIVAIDAVNKDTGETLVVEGVPVAGGTLNIDPNP